MVTFRFSLKGTFLNNYKEMGKEVAFSPSIYIIKRTDRPVGQ